MKSFPACPQTAPLIKDFLKTNCGIQRANSGMIDLVEIFLSMKSAHPTIKYDDNVFYPAKKMKELCPRHYQTIRNACCIMLHCASAEAARCDKIVNWTPAFNDLFIDIAKERLQWEKDLREQQQSSKKFSFHFLPGADPEQYIKTEKSNRLYHNAQNLSREEKRVLYEGCLDFDLVAAFPTIFCKTVLKGEETHPMLDLLLRDPEHFLSLINEHEAYTYEVRYSNDSDRDKAKIMRSRLFHPPSKGKLKKIGVKWYDELADFIYVKLEEAVGEGTAHLFFTAVEAEIIEKAFAVVGYEKVCLRMHDGFIAWGIEEPNDCLEALKAATGYNWACKKV